MAIDMHRDPLVEIWNLWGSAITSPRNPLRTPVLCTVDQNRPAGRTVVLREVLPATRELRFHTDLRSSKVKELAHSPRAEWVFYEPAQGWQFRAGGICFLNTEIERRRSAWLKTPTTSRMGYASLSSPGTALDAEALKEAGKPDHDGFENFGVMACVLDCIEWLQLQPQPHSRTRWDWVNGSWKRSEWVP